MARILKPGNGKYGSLRLRGLQKCLYKNVMAHFAQDDTPFIFEDRFLRTDNEKDEMRGSPLRSGSQAFWVESRSDGRYRKSEFG
jgi:hypothetical protein